MILGGASLTASAAEAAEEVEEQEASVLHSHASAHDRSNVSPLLRVSFFRDVIRTTIPPFPYDKAGTVPRVVRVRV